MDGSDTELLFNVTEFHTTSAVPGFAAVSHSTKQSLYGG